VTSRAGRISYVQIPATDVEASADFYQSVFGWSIRRRDDGHLAFDDTSGQVSGEWVTGRPPAATPGLLVYIRVHEVDQALATIVQHGGRVVTPTTPQKEGEAIATFSDPAGNVMGIFHEPTG
jgi:uncharacterized protein